jgi:protein-disulfide isomerase
VKFQSVFIAFFLVATLAWSQTTTTSQTVSAAAAAPHESQPAPDATLAQRIEENIRAHFNVPPTVNINVGPRQPSEIPGYDAVQVVLSNASHKTPYTFYVSKDGNTMAQMNKMDISQNPLDVSGRPMKGNKDAKVTVIVYDDFQCPFCARGYQTLFKEIMPQYQDRIRIVYKDFPLYEIHPWAVHAAVNANCLFAQSNDAYWDFADYVHTNRDSIQQQGPLSTQFAALDKTAMDSAKKFNLDPEKVQACVKAQDDTAVMASERYGDKALGIDATPTIFVNGMKLDGAVPAEDMRQTLNAALREAGVPVPPNTDAASVDKKSIDDAVAAVKKAQAEKANGSSAADPPQKPASATPPPKNP